ncbi:MAG: CYTH domain-containing protein [bacterium]
MHEIETKVLEVDKEAVTRKLVELGAREVQNTRLVVDWYGPAGLTHAGDDPWYMRVRTTSGGKVEVSWKSLAKIVGNTRQSQEINMNVTDAEKMGEIFKAIGLENYAHQEKDRHSFAFKDWAFDIDTYPGMPTYLEIEGSSVEHVHEALEMLELLTHESISEGERKLIGEKYKLDWFNMRF